jgi:hypothetical protein
VALQWCLFLPELGRLMDGLRASKRHIGDLIQLIDEKNGVNADRDGCDLASHDRSNEMRLLPATAVQDHRILMPVASGSMIQLCTMRRLLALRPYGRRPADVDR